MDAKKYNLPIYILENGLADAKDINRKRFIKEHLIMVHRAIDNGCPIKGYCHWSLLDNFEWKWGFTPKFGLYSVDPQSLVRQPRPSSRFYAKICKNNGF
ncbi:MAG TPA: family 1 glycosylhydrolase, partial [bacterium]|nr:family 1 glycosylhydrolase [bacterium]